MKTILTNMPTTKCFPYLLLAVWLLIPASPPSAVAQYEMDWITQFGTLADDSVSAAAADADGYALAGYTDGSLPGFSNQGYTDVFIRRINKNGNEIWTRQFGTADSDAVGGVALDATGITVVGHTWGAFSGFRNAGYSDAFIRRYDLSGNELWTLQFGTDGNDVLSSVAADHRGIWVGGSTGPKYAEDTFLRRYTFDGTLVWERVIGTELEDYGLRIALDQGGVTATGWTWGTFFPGYVREYLAAGAHAVTIYLREDGAQIDRLDLEADDYHTILAEEAEACELYGAFQIVNDPTASGGRFVHVPNGAGIRDLPDEAHKVVCQFSVAESGLYRIKGVIRAPSPSYANNSFFVKLDGAPPAGYLWDTPESARWTSVAVSDRNSSPTNAAGEGSSDVFVRRYDSDGNLLWTRQFSSEGKHEDFPGGIAADEHGLTVTGHTEGALPGCTYSGVEGTFMRRFAFDGTELWTRQFGTASYGAGSEIATIGDAIVIAGVTNAALSGQTHFGSSDAFLRGYDLDGSELFTVQFGTEAAESTYAIAAGTDDVIVAGFTKGEFPGNSYVGGQDAYVVHLIPEDEGTGFWVQEAEDCELHGAFQIVNDPAASGGSFVHAPNGVGIRDLPDEAHKVVCKIRVASGGTYRIKGVVKAPSPSYTNNSFFVKVDGAPTAGYLWDTPESTRWATDAVSDRNGADPVEVTLQAGTHNVAIYLREDGAQLDKIELESIAVTPNGLASEAEDCELSGAFQIADDPTASEGSYVHAPNGAGTRDLPDEAQKMVCQLSVPSGGTYRIKAVVKAPSPSYANNSFFVKVDGAPGAGYLWDISESTLWTTDEVSDRKGVDPVGVVLTAGVHTVTVYLREDGAQIDKIWLEPGITPANIRIMPLGASITAGSHSGVVDPGGWISYRKDLHDLLAVGLYSTVFVGSLSNGGSVAGFTDVKHEGHTGWHAAGSASSILPKLNGFLTANPPDIVLLHIGTNDINNGQNPAGVAAEINSIFDEIDVYEQNTGRDVWVALALIINQATGCNFRTQTTQLNDLLYAMAAGRQDKGDKIVIVDMENAITDYDKIPNGEMFDCLHPFATGYSRMADAWYQALLDILPTANAGLDQSVDPGVSVSLNGSGSSDSLGTITTYAWTQTAGSPTVKFDNAGAPVTSFTAPSVSGGTILTFKLTITDDRNFSHSDECQVTVITGD